MFAVAKPLRARSVVHLNIADFAVAVERMVDRGLEGRPVIIAQDNAARATVHDMSEEAYQCGIRKSMPLKDALRCCRDAVVRPPHPDRYERAMRDVFREVAGFSPLIEPGEIDGHFFIDVSGTSRLFGPSVDVAWRMYQKIRKSLGLVPIWSVAPNKLVSKVASRLVKPVGEYVVGEGEEHAFLSPLSVHLLPGMEDQDLRQLNDFNISSAKQVADLDFEQLEVIFGKRAGFIFDTVRGIDDTPVAPAGQQPDKIIASRVFGEDTGEVETMEGAMYLLVEKIGNGLRRRRKAAKSLSIMIDYIDGLRCFRNLSVCPPSANDILLFESARKLLYMAWTRRIRVRCIRLTCRKPVHHQPQLTLFGREKKEARSEAVIAAVDDIRRRFGSGAVCMGRSFGR